MTMAAAATPVHADPPQTARARAARIVLFLGLFEFILFGAATFGVTRAAGMSIAELQQLTGANLSREQLEAVHPHLKSFAVVLALCGVVPAALYVLRSAGVKRGLFVASFTGLILACTQLFVLGAILLRQVFIAIAAGDPPILTVSALAIGTPMALLVVVIRCLFQLTWPRARGPAA